NLEFCLRLPCTLNAANAKIIQCADLKDYYLNTRCAPQRLGSACETLPPGQSSEDTSSCLTCSNALNATSLSRLGSRSPSRMAAITCRAINSPAGPRATAVPIGSAT